MRWCADIGVGSLTHRAGTDIACETVRHIEQRGHAPPPVAAGFALLTRSARQRHITAPHLPATSRRSVSTAEYSHCQAQRERAEPLRARQGSAVKPSAPDNGRSTTIASAPGITALETTLANGSDGVPTRPHASEEQHSKCFASVRVGALERRRRCRLACASCWPENRVDRGTCDSPPLRPPASPPFGFT